jgi:hypothetical protein
VYMVVCAPLGMEGRERAHARVSICLIGDRMVRYA